MSTDFARLAAMISEPLGELPPLENGLSAAGYEAVCQSLEARVERLEAIIRKADDLMLRGEGVKYVAADIWDELVKDVVRQ